MWITKEAAEVIDKILEKGKAVEIYLRKNEIVIIEKQTKVKKRIAVDEQR